MIFYAIAAALAPLALRIPDRWLRRIDAAFGTVATTIAGALGMSALTALTLLPMTVIGLDTSVSLLPAVRVLVAYAVFFTFGWLLFRRRDIIEPFGARWKLPMAVGAAASIAYLVVTVARPFQASPQVERLIGCAVAGLSIWMLIFGIVGMFVHKLAHPRPILRYLSDAAYWMYIVHLPIAIGVSAFMATWSAPALVKFLITVSATAVVTLVSYHYLVRATVLGSLLNGRRYPRALPQPEPARELAAV